MKGMFLLSTIISEKYYEKKQLDSSVSIFFSEIQLGKLLRQSNIRKVQGACCQAIFQFIFILIFTGKNLYRLLETESLSSFKKDAIYRFLNCANYNWRRFLLLLSSRIISEKIDPLTSETRKNVLIFDDTTYSRNRSKVVELLANVLDHTRKKYIKGFRLLTLGWSDGNSFLPVAFSLLSSAKEKNRICGISEDIDKRTNGYQRRKESMKKATETMFDLLEQAGNFSIPASYVLFDSWFAFPKVIKKVLEYNYQVVCRLKSMHRVYYNYKGKKYNLKQLYKTLKKNRSKKSKVVASVIVDLGKNKKGENVKAKIIFLRDNKSKSNWIALLTTDIKLKDEEIIRIYGKRWDIEVFFKMNKSYLRLAKEFQGRTYDMMFAHTTIVFTRYILLSLRAREAKDSKTVGGMFFEYCDELEDIKFAEALLLLIDLFKQTLEDCLIITEEKINKLLNYFFNLLPSFIKGKLKVLSCES